ncbi:hypothetical protein GE061_008170 [Apolygus lucorum]|uniref:RNase H type-1 domain-containing protein n=1 Tax=Apolygus lucorum TaxID=248454 RepID=A0A6A4IWX6_APOLU|nr:hypothetical protein GE061_008170 [Apolygus lucorum]
MAKFRLGAGCSNNQAELFAVAEALEWLLHQSVVNTQRSACIYTDSEVSLALLRNHRIHLPTVERVRRLLFNLRGSWAIGLLWVKAHVGVLGNEVADILAKEAAGGMDLPESFSSVPRTFVRRVLHEGTVSSWNELWIHNDETAQYTKQFFPSVYARLRAQLKVNHKLTQALSAHGKNRAYLRRIGIIADDTCPCSEGVPQTWEHLIVDCVMFEPQRSRLIRRTVLGGSGWPVDLQVLVSKYLNDFTVFINEVNFDLF